MHKKTYPSDISRERFEQILPILEQARKRTKPRSVDLYDAGKKVSGIKRHIAVDTLRTFRQVATAGLFPDAAATGCYAIRISN